LVLETAECSPHGVAAEAETVFPEPAALAENRSVDAVGLWLVISIGRQSRTD
jgi:hypothetical protein